MASFTTEQVLPFNVSFRDGRDRTVGVQGEPVAASSDETVATVTLTAGADKSWDGVISSVAPGDGRVTVSADADLGEGVREVVGVLEYTVTLDDRTGARIVDIVAGEPSDKPV